MLLQKNSKKDNRNIDHADIGDYNIDSFENNHPYGSFKLFYRIRELTSVCSKCNKYSVLYHCNEETSRFIWNVKNILKIIKPDTFFNTSSFESFILI